MRLARIVAAIVILVIAGWALQLLLAGPSTDEGDRLDVVRSDLTIEIPATGVLAAARSVDLSAPISGNPHFFRLESLVDEGTVVEAGDTVMELDGQEVKRRIEDEATEASKTRDEKTRRQLEFDLQLRDLRVRLEEARVRKETATLKNVVDPELLSAQERREFQLELEQATQAHTLLVERLALTERQMTSELALFDQTLTNIEIRLQRARDLENSLVVKAPIAGTLVHKVMADGAKRKVGERTCHHEVILQIPNLASLRVEATVNEQHAGSVQTGQPARIRLDALPDLALSGRVTEVGTALRTERDNPIKVVEVVVELDENDLRLNPGMTASVHIEIERLPETLVAPHRFVYERDGAAFARVRGRGGRVEERSIRVGRRNESLVELVEGIDEGETLVTP